MSTPSRIFNEQIFKVNSSESGKKTFEFQVENDGFILNIDYISGASNTTYTVTNIMPDNMSDLQIDKITITPGEINEVKRYAYIAGRRASVTVAWEGATEIILSVRAVSAEAVNALSDNTESLLKDNNVLIGQLINAVHINEEVNRKILNHLRHVTEIEDDQGEEF
jgi:hypothetical protein